MTNFMEPQKQHDFLSIIYQKEKKLKHEFQNQKRKLKQRNISFKKP